MIELRPTTITTITTDTPIITLNFNENDKIERNRNSINSINSINNNNKNYDVINKLFLEMKENIGNGMEKCKWLIINTCCLFLTLLSWEIVGDKEEWNKSYWIPGIGVGIIIILLLIDYTKFIQKIIITFNK